MNIEGIKAKFQELTLIEQAIGIVIIMVLSWGVIGPSLISSKSDIGVYIGIAIVVFNTYASWKLSSKIRKELTK